MDKEKEKMEKKVTRLKRQMLVPPCASCTQLAKYCKGKQLKNRSKRCQLLLSHVVQLCHDGEDIYDIAKILNPQWYSSKIKSVRDKKDISKKLLSAIKTIAHDNKKGSLTNSKYNTRMKNSYF